MQSSDTSLAKLVEITVLSETGSVIVQPFLFFNAIQGLYSVTEDSAPKSLELFILKLLKAFIISFVF